MADEPGRRIQVPQWLADNFQAFTGSGAAPAVPRRAATVVLLRSGVPGTRVYVLERARTMAFAGGMYAFPGGSVDPADHHGQSRWIGPEPRWWADRLGLSTMDATAVVRAAVRELFEESGVLLAGPDDSTVVDDVDTPEWEECRLALLTRQTGLDQILSGRNLAVRTDLLAPWARWLTPEFEPRRFDTFFFVARLPDGQRTRDVGGEAVRTSWLTPGAALDLPMLPPTAVTLREIDRYAAVDDVFAASAHRNLTMPVTPRLETDPDGTAHMRF